MNYFAEDKNDKKVEEEKAENIKGEEKVEEEKECGR